MPCLICTGKVTPYFQKDFKGVFELQNVKYERCTRCGFCFARTLYELDDNIWSRLNNNFHSQVFEVEKDPECIKIPSNSPIRLMRERGLTRLRKQANTLLTLAKHKIISNKRPWLDWGCGNGSLANHITSQGYPVSKYDKYMYSEHSDYIAETELKTPFNLVINTAVFEHVRHRSTLDEILKPLSDDGAFALHVWVAEDVPINDSWFYLLPVHCSFYTNQSMKILFKEWGFKSSIYHLPSRLWIWFRKEPDSLQPFIKTQIPGEWFYAKDFVAYWQ